MASAREELRGAVRSFSGLWKSSRKKTPDESDDKDAEKETSDASHLVAYHYARLSTPGSIRLLELQTGGKDDLIACKLQQVELKTCVKQYEALSYVWGSSEGSTQIQVDDASLEIGPNLLCALKDLRRIDSPRLLWVDAISIDQSNLAERNCQVPLMREIYSQAACTLCYLGPKTKNTVALYVMLEELAHEAENTQANTPNYDAVDTLPSFINHLPLLPVKSDLYEKYLGDNNIEEIAECKWWHRAWTAQELLLSSKSLMMTGAYTIEWQKLCRAVDHGLNAQIWAPLWFGFYLQPMVVPYLSMRALMNRRRRQSQRPAEDLMHLLIHCRHRDSTDPRDKIYSILGLLRNEHSDVMTTSSLENLNIKLDYSFPVVYIYRKISQELIQNLDNLDILGVCPKSNRRALPSWVTDWSITSPTGSPLMQDSLDRARTTHAAKHTKARAIFPDDGVTIIIRGYELTEVATLAEPLIWGSFLEGLAHANDEIIDREVEKWIEEQDLSRFKGPLSSARMYMSLAGKAAKVTYNMMHGMMGDLLSVFQVTFAWEKYAVAHPPTNLSEDKASSVFWHTLCAGTYKDESADKTEAIFKAWSDGLQPVREFLAKHLRTSKNVPSMAIATYMRSSWDQYSEFWPYTACARHRRMGTAANDWLCLLPEETRVGDKIILACGGRVPLVVRSDGDGYNQFIGEAYIHGIMDGEAFEEEKCQDIKIC